ncbi:hypothetical protein B0H16DRAFT_428135 [Mycena metata]|uniref:SMODS and SLOG-associating 2TM effector domain-containing protein n=1 Tax=Mycena metata TaxID=1033252 RepID=A0AAD7JIR2_9AGAR|nr:hypothetical protein B0H16DRAFT_428135 [Mycena metata]
MGSQQNQPLPPLPDIVESPVASPVSSGHHVDVEPPPSSPRTLGPTSASHRVSSRRATDSSQPVVPDERPMSGTSFLLPRHPEDAQNVPRAFTDPRSSDFRSGIERRQSELDWIVPKRESRQRNLADRLRPTLDTAKTERDKFNTKAKITGMALNIAIGLQVLLGALTTGLSAVTSGRQTSITVSILGGLSTVVASYLARARGSNEPELSIARCKDLDQYIRECEIFILDHGYSTGNEHDSQLNTLRDRFEELLGNGNGERRLAPPV